MNRIFGAAFAAACLLAIVSLALIPAGLGILALLAAVLLTLLLIAWLHAVPIRYAGRFERGRPSTRRFLSAVLSLGCALAMTACASTSATNSLTPAQTLEQADTAASLAYAATATALNAYEAASPAGVAKAEAIKAQAWAALLKERALYGEGQDVTAALAALQSLETQAKAL